MSKKSTIILVLLVIAFQKSFASVFDQHTLDHLQYIHDRLEHRHAGPVLKRMINGLHDIVSDTDASSALETTLTETLKMTENQALMELYDFVIEALTQVIEDQNVRQVLLNRLTLSNEVFNKDTAKAFITKIIQTSFRIMTDKEVLKGIRQILKAGTVILTDTESQNKISALLLQVLRIIKNPEALRYLETSVKAMDHILSSVTARYTILNAITDMTSTMNHLSDNQARRIGIAQTRLASINAN